ncbi:SsrA-binding protein SmpB [Patescibacteria group bacterium]|nr:MAG: SsrA-binding protein SmpB [Patescibacteria group bacterium]
MKIIADNRRARLDYEFLDELEVGIVLLGQEVKSAKGGGLRLRGSYARLHDGALWLVGAYIAPYPPAGPLAGYDPQRSRKLLAHSREVLRIMGRMKTERLTLVPKEAYTRGGRIKLALALARSKRAFEKRAAIRKRELQREIGRSVRKKAV